MTDTNDLPTFPDLRGRSIFITGGGSGIGASLTEAFLRQGARVAFVQRSDAGAFADEMERATGARPLALRGDITDLDALRGAIGDAASAHGAVAVLVNNAANDQRHATLDTDESFWDWSMSINLKAYYFAAQAVIPGMREAGGGSIVNFSSITYMMGMADMPAYVTANAGITGMTRSLAREFGGEGVRVNALAPGWVLTEKQKEKWATDAALAAHLDRQCLKAHLAPADIMAPTLFLASAASRMVTGQVLVVDGGVVATG